MVEKAREETLRDWNHFKELLSVCAGCIILHYNESSHGIETHQIVSQKKTVVV